jgi:hypothetical protein
MVPQHFQLVAPYETDPTRWLTMQWLDRHSTKQFHITTSGDSGDRVTARVSTYHEMIEDYAHHPESKCADALGQPADRQTVGLLYRRHVSVGEIHMIGKESNGLENVEAGVEHDAENVYTDYPILGERIGRGRLSQPCKPRSCRCWSRHAKED